MSINHTPTTTSEKLQKHFDDNITLYLTGAALVATGYFLGKTRMPKVNPAKVVESWMEETAKKGFNVYALTNEQRDLWESTWKWVNTYAQDWDISTAEAIKDVLRKQGAYIEDFTKTQLARG
jgi:hypothetical protein